jgi:hypothetical protein
VEASKGSRSDDPGPSEKFIMSTLARLAQLGIGRAAQARQLRWDTISSETAVRQ